MHLNISKRQSTAAIPSAIGKTRVSENQRIGSKTIMAQIAVMILFNIAYILSYTAKSALATVKFLNCFINVLCGKIGPELVNKI
jgi:hypothetical protein